MIWDSILLKTVIDLLIVGVATYGLAFLLRTRRRDTKRHAIGGMGAIILGLTVIGGFFFADLLFMHVLPLFVPRARAMAILTEMHLNYHWVVALGATSLIGLGLIAAVRQTFALVDRAEASETRSRHELELRQGTEDALRQSEARLKRAQRQAKLGYWRWSFEEQRLTYWSEETAEICGYAKSGGDVPYDRLVRAFHPEDGDRVLAEYHANDLERRDYRIEYRIVNEDGEIRHVREIGEIECGADGEPIARVGTVQDITDLKETEEALRKSEARLAGILDIAPEAVISIDKSSRIRLFNQGAESIFGYDSEEVLGQPIELLMPRQYREGHVALVEALDRAPEAGHSMSRWAEITGVRKDGSEFPAEASISKLDLGGEMVFTVLLRDITERKAVERTILRGKEEAEVANRAKSEFLANMSHELRTPLNAIIGFAEIIMGEVLGPVGNEKYRGYAKDINDSGQHLLEIINDILDLSKIETGQVDLRKEEIDVSVAVRSCLKLVRERARSAGVELVADFDFEAYPYLFADRRMLKQILVNLLSNAVKFTPQGGRITVSARCDPAAGYTLTIADTGIGIAPDDIPKALARFEQVDARIDRRFEGTGLGLPLSKAFVELHGGSFELESEVGVGTTVTIRFPAGCVRPCKSDQIADLGEPVAREAS